MPAPTEKPELSSRQAADLSALADGTLDPARRDEVQAWISASPERTALFEAERGVVELLHQARATDRAPERLRARIEASRPPRRVLARRRIALSGGLAAGLAAVVLALVLLAPGGTPGAPSLSQAADVADLGPAQPAPTPDPAAPNRLGRDIQDVYFPNWSSRFGWSAVGQRTDVVNGRQTVTVYYQRQGRRIAYTIVATPVLAAPSARVSYRDGVQLRTLMLNGRLVVTWRRAGHTCVLSAQGVPPAALHALAAWKAPQAQ